MKASFRHNKMVQVQFDPTSSLLTIRQSGDGAFYEGRVFQRGRGGLGRAGRYSGEGLGSVMSNVWHFLRPMALSAFKTVGKEAADTGSRILSNLAQGANLKETVAEHGQEGVRRVLERATKRMQRGRGLPALKSRRRLKGIKAPALAPHPKVILKPEDLLIGKSVAQSTAIRKRAKKDNLGLY